MEKLAVHLSTSRGLKMLLTDFLKINPCKNKALFNHQMGVYSGIFGHVKGLFKRLHTVFMNIHHTNVVNSTANDKVML